VLSRCARYIRIYIYVQNGARDIRNTRVQIEMLIKNRRAAGDGTYVMFQQLMETSGTYKYYRINGCQDQKRAAVRRRARTKLYGTSG